MWQTYPTMTRWSTRLGASEHGSDMGIAMDMRTNSAFESPLVKKLELVLLGLVLLIVYGTGIQSVSFRPDESIHIALSYSLEAFVHGDLGSPIWNESHRWTLDQPPVGRYVIGMGRLCGGYGVADLNRPWNFGLDGEENVNRGAVPNPSLLWWSRLPMAILAAGCGLILFRVVGMSAGRVAGYAALLMFSANSFLLEHLRRAMLEAPLLFWILLAGLAAAYALRSWACATARSNGSWRTLSRPLLWFALMGALAGLAGATKLNGLSAAFAGGLLCLAAPLRYDGDIPKPVYLLAIGAAAATMIATGFTFVLFNPFLYPDPVTRTGKLFVHRVRVIGGQLAEYPE